MFHYLVAAFSFETHHPAALNNSPDDSISPPAAKFTMCARSGLKGFDLFQSTRECSFNLNKLGMEVDMTSEPAEVGDQGEDLEADTEVEDAMKNGLKRSCSAPLINQLIAAEDEGRAQDGARGVLSSAAARLRPSSYLPGSLGGSRWRRWSTSTSSMGINPPTSPVHGAVPGGGWSRVNRLKVEETKDVSKAEIQTEREVQRGLSIENNLSQSWEDLSLVSSCIVLLLTHLKCFTLLYLRVLTFHFSPRPQKRRGQVLVKAEVAGCPTRLSLSRSVSDPFPLLAPLPHHHLRLPGLLCRANNASPPPCRCLSPTSPSPPHPRPPQQDEDGPPDVHCPQ